MKIERDHLSGSAVSVVMSLFNASGVGDDSHGQHNKEGAGAAPTEQALLLLGRSALHTTSPSLQPRSGEMPAGDGNDRCLVV